MPGGPMLSTKASMCAWRAGRSHVASRATDVTGAGHILRAPARSRNLSACAVAHGRSRDLRGRRDRARWAHARHTAASMCAWCAGRSRVASLMVGQETRESRSLSGGPMLRTKAKSEATGIGECLHSEATGIGERHAHPGDRLRARRAAASATLAKSKSHGRDKSELWPLVAASVTPVWAISCVRAEQQPVLPRPRAKQRLRWRARWSRCRGERHAWQGDQLLAPSSSRCCPSRERKQRQKWRAS